MRAISPRSPESSRLDAGDIPTTTEVLDHLSTMAQELASLAARSGLPKVADAFTFARQIAEAEADLRFEPGPQAAQPDPSA